MYVYRVKTFIGFGMGAGASVLSRFAVSVLFNYPDILALKKMLIVYMVASLLLNHAR